MNCPVCQEEMTTELVYDVETDMCRKHGLWLDKGELKKIAQAWRADQGRMADDGGHDRQTGRIEGMFLGWLSLLLPK